MIEIKGEKIYSLKEALELGVVSGIGKQTVSVPTLGLDKVLGEVREDDFVVITARGGTGKTWLMLQMATDMAKAGERVAFFSGEMSVADIAGTRLVRMFPETTRIHKGTDPSKAIESISSMEDSPIFFPNIEKRYPFRTQCTEIMKELTEKHGVRVFFFDHMKFFLNLPDGFKSDERSIIEQTVMDMRLYAKANKTPIFLAVQPRQIHSDEEATIDSLKGSSAISQDATNVLVLDRPRKKKSKDRNNGAQDEDVVYEPFTVLKVEKARHAQGNARIRLYLDYQNGRFLEWTNGGSDLHAQHAVLSAKP